MILGLVIWMFEITTWVLWRKTHRVSWDPKELRCPRPLWHFHHWWPGPSSGAIYNDIYHRKNGLEKKYKPNNHLTYFRFPSDAISIIPLCHNTTKSPWFFYLLPVFFAHCSPGFRPNWPEPGCTCNKPWLGPAIAVSTMATTMAPASQKSPESEGCFCMWWA